MREIGKYVASFGILLMSLKAKLLGAPVGAYVSYTVKACPHCRRFRRQFVAENGFCRRKATVAEFGNCRRFLAVFGGSRRFR